MDDCRSTSGYVRDENGKLRAVPLARGSKKSQLGPNSQSSAENSGGRKKIPLMPPLFLTAADFGEPPQYVKDENGKILKDENGKPRMERLHLRRRNLESNAQTSGEKDAPGRKQIPLKPLFLTAADFGYPPEYVRDENGKILRDEDGKPRMVRLVRGQKYSGSKSQSSVGKNVGGGIKNTIKPLGLTRANFADSPKSKKRKMDKPVCKQLFKVPTTKVKTSWRASSQNFRWSVRRSSSFSKSVKPSGRKTATSTLPNNDSPLLDIDKAEELLKNEGIIKKPIETHIVSVIKITSVSPESIKLDKTTDSAELDTEFLKLEEACISPDDIQNEDDVKLPMPLTSILSAPSTGKALPKASISNSTTEKIQALLKQNDAKFTLLKVEIQRLLANYEQQRQRTIAEIENLLNDDSDKENSARKSLRIASQVSVKKTTCALTPKMRNAVDSYNALRSNYNVLCTPHMEQHNRIRIQPNVTRSLSRRLQQQYLLLQDTPK